MPAYLRPTAPIAADVLLPGDPKLAMDLAIRLIGKPLMSNHARGLWGYSGLAATGEQLTVQSGGIGGASTAAVVADLAELGVRRVIRVGTCTAAAGGPDLGEAVVVGAVHAADGIGRALAHGRDLEPDRGLLQALERASGRVAARIVSVDGPIGGPVTEPGVAAQDLSSAAALAFGARLGVEVGCALVVTRDERGGSLTDDAATSAAIELGEAALAALAAAQPPAAPGPSA